MVGIAALAILQASLQPDFALPIQPAPILLIKAPLDGRPALFGIDTGSMNLLLKPRRQTAGPTATVDLPFLSSQPLTAKIGYFPTPANGIIGLNDLRDKAIGIDVKDTTLSLYKAGNLTSDQVAFYFSHTPSDSTWTSSDAVPYETINLLDAPDGHFLIDGQVEGRPIKFGLDTDSAFSSIAADMTPAQFVPLVTQSVGGLNGAWPLKIGVVQNISFGKQNLPSFAIAQAPAGSLAPAQGLIGFNIFENRRALIDFPAHKLYLGDLNPAPIGEEALLPFGIRLLPDLNGHQLIAVIPGSPADKAGLKSGDEITQINGKPVGQMNLGSTGSTLPFDFSRQGLPPSLSLAAGRNGSQTNYTVTRA